MFVLAKPPIVHSGGVRMGSPRASFNGATLSSFLPLEFGGAIKAREEDHNLLNDLIIELCTTCL